MKVLTWRVRLARWIMGRATWLAWRIAGKPAFGRFATTGTPPVVELARYLWG
jgi:hypothetical protein